MGAGFNDGYWSLLAGLIDAAGARGMHLILDPHQYGRRRSRDGAQVIGESASVTAGHFAAFWRELAQRCRSQPHVVFGLQNEPHDQDQATLARVHTTAIAAIRDAGARNLVLAPGSAWTGAHSWVSSGNAESAHAVVDPLDRMAYEVHQYLDRDSSGRSAGCIAGAGARLEPFTRWARQHGKRGFLGEFGGGPSEGCALELAALLEHIRRNRDVWVGWTCWAGGPWWGDNYPLSLEPASLDTPRDRPQMAVLRRYFE
jgi:endoglucanase